MAPRPDPSDSEFLLPGSRTQVGMLQSFLVKNHCIIAFFFFFCFSEEFTFFITLTKESDSDPFLLFVSLFFLFVSHFVVTVLLNIG